MDFFGGVYQEPPPDVFGRHVVIVDFSYKNDVMADIARKAQSVLVLDHHRTARAELIEWTMPWPYDVQPDKTDRGPFNKTLTPIGELPSAGCTAYFDMERSGARLAWDYFFSGRPVPPIVQFAEDYDLWLFALPQTKQVVAAMYSYPQEFGTWNAIADMLEGDERKELVDQGKAILRSNVKNYEQLVENGMQMGMVGGVRMPVVNAPWFMASEIGNMLAKMSPTKIGATFWVNSKGEEVWSLRSLQDGPDVSEIAKRAGGGGHKNAAGFKVAPKTTLLEMPITGRIS